MHILTPRFTAKPFLNEVWRAVRRTWIAPFVSHEAQLPVAHDLRRYQRTQWAPAFAQAMFGQPLQGAGYAWESRRWVNPVADTTIATTGANTKDFNIYDFSGIAVIGFVWTVAGTVTALVMDFDFYPQLNHLGTVVDKLDGTNGVITAPTVAGQAINNVLFKDYADLFDVLNVDPGNSIQAIVTTTTTAGNGMPFILGVPRAETFANLSRAVKAT